MNCFSPEYTLNRTEQLIVGVLGNGPASVQQLLKLGVCKAHVYNCLNRLLLLKVIERIGHGLYKLLKGVPEVPPAPIPTAQSGVPAKFDGIGDLTELISLLRQILRLLTGGLFTQKSTESLPEVDQKSTQSGLSVY